MKRSPSKDLKKLLGTDKTRSYKKSDMDLREDLSLDGDLEVSFLKDRNMRLTRKQQNYIISCGVKQCTTCLLVLRFNSFPKANTSKHGVRSSCFDCHKYFNSCYTVEKVEKRQKDLRNMGKKIKEERNKRKREAYQKNKQYYREYYKRKKAQKLREFLKKKKENLLIDPDLVDAITYNVGSQVKQREGTGQ